MMKRNQKELSRRENPAFYFVLRMNDANVTGKCKKITPLSFFFVFAVVSRLRLTVNDEAIKGAEREAKGCFLDH